MVFAYFENNNHSINCVEKLNLGKDTILGNDIFAGTNHVICHHLVPDYPVRQLRDRLRVLYRVSDLVKTSWRLLPTSIDVEKLWPSKDLVTLTSLKKESVRLMLSPQVYNLPLVQTLQKTMVQGRNYGPQVRSSISLDDPI